MKINITTENEIMLGLLKRYVKQDISDEEKIVLLTELEYYVHQVNDTFCLSLSLSISCSSHFKFVKTL